MFWDRVEVCQVALFIATKRTVMVTLVERKFIEAVVQLICIKGVLNNIAKFTGKHLCQNLFLLIKLQA